MHPNPSGNTTPPLKGQPTRPAAAPPPFRNTHTYTHAHTTTIGGDLFNYISRRPAGHRRLSERRACKFLLQLIDGLSFLKDAGIAHRCVLW